MGNNPNKMQTTITRRVIDVASIVGELLWEFKTGGFSIKTSTNISLGFPSESLIYSRLHMFIYTKGWIFLARKMIRKGKDLIWFI